MIKKLTINCKILGVGGGSPALLHGKYTACRAGYIGMKGGVKSRDRVREEEERRKEQRRNK